MKTAFNTFVHKTPASTLSYCPEDTHVYLSFVDRNVTIKYPLNSDRGAYLSRLAQKRGVRKVTKIRNEESTNPVAFKQLSLF
jgi:hypothetical protein